MELTDLLASILADKIVTSEEVAQLEEAIFADGKVTKDEVSALFEVKETATELDPSFGPLLSKAVVTYFKDNSSNGIISKEAGDLVCEAICKDTTIDEMEQSVLDAVNEEFSGSFSEGLTHIL